MGLDAPSSAARIRVLSGMATLWDSGSYEYDALSQIRSIGVAPELGTHQATFTHDAHGRLVMAELPGRSVGAPWPSAAEGGFSGGVFSAGGVHDSLSTESGQGPEVHERRPRQVAPNTPERGVK